MMNYVLACLTHLSDGSSRVVVKVRGRSILRAADTIELLRFFFAKVYSLRA